MFTNVTNDDFFSSICQEEKVWKERETKVNYFVFLFTLVKNKNKCQKIFSSILKFDIKPFKWFKMSCF
jgi:hypothetical protein